MFLQKIMLDEQNVDFFFLKSIPSPKRIVAFSLFYSSEILYNQKIEKKGI